MAVKNNDEYKDIRDQLAHYNSKKETSYMLMMLGFVGIVVTLVVLAIMEL